MDTGSEWAQNKKVVDLSQKDVRSAVSLWFSYLDTLLIECIRKLVIFIGKKLAGSEINCDEQPRVKTLNCLTSFANRFQRDFLTSVSTLVCKVDSPMSLKKRKIFLVILAE